MGDRDVTTKQVVRWQRAVGQVADASTETTLYDCPVQRLARGRVYVCNRAAAARTFRIRYQVGGAADDNKQFLAYDAPLAANEDTHTEELILDATDSLEVFASANDVTFQFIGSTEPKDTT